MDYLKHLEKMLKISGEASSIRVIGQVTTRQTFYEVDRVIFAVNDYVAIHNEWKKED